MTEKPQDFAAIRKRARVNMVLWLVSFSISAVIVWQAWARPWDDATRVALHVAAVAYLLFTFQLTYLRRPRAEKE